MRMYRIMLSLATLTAYSVAVLTPAFSEEYRGTAEQQMACTPDVCASTRFRTSTGSRRACGKTRRSSPGRAVRCSIQMPASPIRRRRNVATISPGHTAPNRRNPAALCPQERDDGCDSGQKREHRNRGEPPGLPAVIAAVMKAEPVPHKPGRNV